MAQYKGVMCCEIEAQRVCDADTQEVCKIYRDSVLCKHAEVLDVCELLYIRKESGDLIYGLRFRSAMLYIQVTDETLHTHFSAGRGGNRGLMFTNIKPPQHIPCIHTHTVIIISKASLSHTVSQVVQKHTHNCYWPSPSTLWTLFYVIMLSCLKSTHGIGCYMLIFWRTGWRL